MAPSTRLNNQQIEALILTGWRYDASPTTGQRVYNGRAYYERRGVSSWQRYVMADAK